MAEEFDEEALRRRFLQATVEEVDDAPPSAQKSVAAAVKEANIQTGSRDLTGLMITSLFSTLLIFFAPIASLIARKHQEKKSR